MRVIIQPNKSEMSRWAAHYIVNRILMHQKLHQRPFVLGLPTGSTPIGTYQEMIRLHKEGIVSFKNVITFNMDEYIGLPEEHEQSYHTFMKSTFFDHVDIEPKNINIPNGNAADLEQECAQYEDKIVAAGGIDLFLGGIGADGHLAFNEPASSLASKTRIKTLTHDTIVANSRFFGGDINLVPKHALTVGISTILSAQEVIILAQGHQKATAVMHAVERGVNHMWTVSALQLHQKGIIACDEEAVTELKYGTVKYFKDIESENLSPETQLKQ